MITLSTSDRDQLAQHGLEADEAIRQVALLRDPPPAVQLLRPCTLGDGIRRLDDEDPGALESAWSRATGAGRVTKLVPASGAASRMFAALEAVRAGAGGNDERSALDTVRENIERFGFYRQLVRASGGEADLRAADTARFLALLLGSDGLDLASKPKALVPFHRDDAVATGGRTAIEEHLLESRGYLRDGEAHCRVHLTVGDRHLNAIKAYLAEDPNGLLARDETIYELGFSTQAPATDTLAIDRAGEPFRCDDGSLLLRPGGHGALLRNLQEMGGDIVVLKNIDNTAVAERHEEIAHVLRRLIGHAVLLSTRLQRAQARLEANRDDERAVDLALRLLAETLGISEAREYLRRRFEHKRTFASDCLARPLRICGVVRNAGEPGGGPFWVRAADGGVSAQIVEAAEVDRNHSQQRAIFARATHFNPVLLVCMLRDTGGEPYDLSAFADPRRVFIADKTAFGRPLRALEHPGLWNGGMARWNTVFVEVPDVVFAPVKTVLDLLRPAHQSS